MPPATARLWLPPLARRQTLPLAKSVNEQRLSLSHLCSLHPCLPACRSPQVNPELEGPTLPSKSDEEFRPFVRRLPEFKFWWSSVKETHDVAGVAKAKVCLGQQPTYIDIGCGCGVDPCDRLKL